MFAKSPNPDCLSISAIRSEILLLYDRWSRTDTGGFLKALRTIIGVHEEIEQIENFRSILNVPYESLCFNVDIKNRCMHNLKTRLDRHISDAEKALKSLELTISHVSQVQAKFNQLGTAVPENILKYFTGMSLGMSHLLSLRKTALEKISGLESFSKHFDETQQILLLVSESNCEYIHEHAKRSHGNVDLSIPTKFSTVLDSGGRELFASSKLE